MGLQIETIEHSSAIVVTLTSATDVGALEPLQDALRVAASEGTTVVLDISEITHNCPLTEIIDAFGPAMAAIKLVAPSAAGPLDRPLCQHVVYPSVDAAIAAARTTSNLAKQDLAAEFDALADHYAQMIDHCPQFLDKAELSAGASAQPWHN
jgi:hypothetical protein